ncbi:MAG: DUF3040 domain-containing protein [Microbacteriaceae bacterium]
MPLSEQEQRLLDEMERNLYQTDADFVASVSGQRPGPSVRSVVLGVLISLVGVAALVAGVAVRQPLVGVAGFAAMLAGVLLAVAPPRRLGARLGAPAPSGARRPAPKSFMDRLGERWDRRRDERES